MLEERCQELKSLFLKILNLVILLKSPEILKKTKPLFLQQEIEFYLHWEQSCFVLDIPQVILY